MLRQVKLLPYLQWLLINCRSQWQDWKSIIFSALINQPYLKHGKGNPDKLSLFTNQWILWIYRWTNGALIRLLQFTNLGLCCSHYSTRIIFPSGDSFTLIIFFFVFFRVNKTWYFMCWADNLHEMSSLIFSEKEKSKSSAANLLGALRLKGNRYIWQTFCHFLLARQLLWLPLNQFTQKNRVWHVMQTDAQTDVSMTQTKEFQLII